MKKVLITGFEPFGGDRINPALEAIKQLDGISLTGGCIVTCQVPVVRFEAIAAVQNAIEQHQPDVVLAIGQAAGRAGITPERVAINVDDFRIADNSGLQVIDEAINPEGPAAYFSTLPIKAMVAALRDAQIPAQVSNSAGTFVCNHLFYGLMDYIAIKQCDIRCGFIHIPLLPEQAQDGELASMPLNLIVQGLTIAAQTALDCANDIKVNGGAIC